MSQPPRPALFLDRDGVLNVDRGYVSRIEDFEWIEGAKACIKAFNARNWWVFVVTNQSGIARGYYTEADMQSLHAHMAKELAELDAKIDHFYFSPYHEAGEIARYRKASPDRKPGPGMLISAMRDYPVIKEQSFMIGDKQTDMQAAQAAGLPGFLFTAGNIHDFAEQALTKLQKT